MSRDTTRRRAIRWGGIVTVAGLAGCTGMSSDSPDEEPAHEESTDEEPTDQGTRDETGARTDDPPTQFSDDFSGESLDAYRVIAGERAQWDVEERIDGPSAHATAAGGYADTLLAPRADRFRWTGTGTVALDVSVREPNYNRNAIVEFGDPDGDTWRVKVAFSGRKIKVISPSERIESVPASPDPGAPHRLEVSVADEAVAVSLDGERRIEFGDPSPLPPGTVGFGIGSNESKGGQTWFDDVSLRSG